MSSYLAVFLKFILPMAALAGFGLFVMRLVEKSARSRGTQSERPWPVVVLVFLWGYAVGAKIFQVAQFVVNAITGDVPLANSSYTEAWIWVGLSLLTSVLLAAAAYALFNLRQSVIRLYFLYLAIGIGVRVVLVFIRPDETVWRGQYDVMEIALIAATLGYLYHLRSRARLV